METVQHMIYVCMRGQVGDNIISFSTTINTNKLVTVLEVSNSHQSIMGGANPNHKICTHYM